MTAAPSGARVPGARTATIGAVQRQDIGRTKKPWRLQHQSAANYQWSARIPRLLMDAAPPAALSAGEQMMRLTGVFQAQV